MRWLRLAGDRSIRVRFDIVERRFWRFIDGRARELDLHFDFDCNFLEILLVVLLVYMVFWLRLLAGLEFVDGV